MSGLFLSDLHLFSRRSVGQQYWDQHRDLIASASSIVLGGDIFDFRWSRLGDFDTTLAAADAWIQGAIALNSDASWVYLLGNHDCHPRVQQMLTSLSEQYSSFRWSPTHWQIGPNVFLHGDVLDGMQHAGGLDGYRAHFHEEKPRGPLSNLLYSAILPTRLQGLIPRLRHTRHQTCRRLLDYLKSCDNAPLTAATNIYFGHTHVPMHDYAVDEFRFFNPGSGIRYLTFQPASFTVP